MFKDKFVGGPLDGEVRDVSAETMEGANVRERESGTEYERAPQLDSDEHRVWIRATSDRSREAPTPEGTHAGPPLQVVVENRKGMTLGEVARFVDGARRNGWTDDDRVTAVSGWTLKLQKLSMRD